MWLHLVIFILLGGIAAAWRFGVLPGMEQTDRKSRRRFLLLGAAGNFLGLLLTLQNLQTRLPEDYKMPRKTSAYREEFMVSVDGEESESVTVQVPQLETEENTDEVQTQIDEQEQERRAFRQMLEEYNQQIQDEDYYHLPASFQGKNYLWDRPRDNTGSLLAALFLVAAAATLLLKSREAQSEMVRRHDQLLMDYPELIMKFTMLIQSGMTVRNAFGKMASDYKRKKGDSPRYAYEELVRACHEMEGGVPEAEVYYRYGEHCGQVKYKTLATLLVQNLTKGSRQLTAMLEKESQEAWDERKRKARVLGEAASTKLLFPMILMMLVVMAVVMVPALASFYGT